MMTCNADEMAEGLAELYVAKRAESIRFMTIVGATLEGNIKLHEAGRPGPEIGPSGDFRRNTTRLPLLITDRQMFAKVANDSPQALRLEFGFMGMTDSIGRTFHQPPYPSFGPGFDDTLPEFDIGLQALAES